MALFTSLFKWFIAIPARLAELPASFFDEYGLVILSKRYGVAVKPIPFITLGITFIFYLYIMLRGADQVR